LAVEHALSCGHSVYDFMAGARQHKASLSTNQDHLYWIVIRRPTGVARLRRQLLLLRRRKRSGVASAKSRNDRHSVCVVNRTVRPAHCSERC
jgi:hypothetical protein